MLSNAHNAASRTSTIASLREGRGTKQLASAASLALACAALSGCASTVLPSVTGGEARAIKPPEFAIRGATAHDQQWIDETVEAGVQGLDWPRPKPRPPEWDRKPADFVKELPRPPTAKPKKKPLWKRLLRRPDV